jgi:hypothetical protein
VTVNDRMTVIRSCFPQVIPSVSHTAVHVHAFSLY